MERHYRPAPTRDTFKRRSWQQGLWKRAPILSFLALLFALLCGVALALVLVMSNGSRVDDWDLHGYQIQPAVLLSLFATLSNALLRYAFLNAVTIFWWTRALKGVTIRDLHQCWNYGQSAFVTFQPTRRMMAVSIASFCTFILLIDGPLLQRASGIATATREVNTSLTIPVSPSPFVRYATGIYAARSSTPNLYNPLFADVLQQYNQRQSIRLSGVDCKGTCYFDVQAAGFDIECRSWTSPYHLMSSLDYTEDGNGGMSSNASYHGPARDHIVFSSNVTLSSPGASQGMNFSSMIKSTPGENGTLNWQSCYLQEGVQRYPVAITNGILTLRPMPALQNYTRYVVQRAYEFGGLQNGEGSTTGGLWLEIQNSYQGQATFTNEGPYTSVSASSVGLTYLRSANAMDLSTYAVTWEDPIPDMIAELRELSLRTAIATTFQTPSAVGDSYPPVNNSLSAPQLDLIVPNMTAIPRPLSQQVMASMIYDETVYQSHYGWLAGALSIIVLAMVTVLPLLNHWSQLGRAVSLSPIEVAHAFEARLFEHVDSNATAKEMITQVGSLQVRYGVASAPKEEHSMTAGNRAEDFADPKVEKREDSVVRKRIAFGRSDSIVCPRRGDVFYGYEETQEESKVALLQADQSDNSVSEA